VAPRTRIPSSLAKRPPSSKVRDRSRWELGGNGTLPCPDDRGRRRDEAEVLRGMEDTLRMGIRAELAAHRRAAAAGPAAARGWTRRASRNRRLVPKHIVHGGGPKAPAGRPPAARPAAAPSPRPSPPAASGRKPRPRRGLRPQPSPPRLRSGRSQGPHRRPAGQGRRLPPRRGLRRHAREREKVVCRRAGGRRKSPARRSSQGASPPPGRMSTPAGTDPFFDAEARPGLNPPPGSGAPPVARSFPQSSRPLAAPQAPHPRRHPPRPGPRPFGPRRHGPVTPAGAPSSYGSGGGRFVDAPAPAESRPPPPPVDAEPGSPSRVSRAREVRVRTLGKPGRFRRWGRSASTRPSRVDHNDGLSRPVTPCSTLSDDRPPTSSSRTSAPRTGTRRQRGARSRGTPGAARRATRSRWGRGPLPGPPSRALPDRRPPKFSLQPKTSSLGVLVQWDQTCRREGPLEWPVGKRTNAWSFFRGTLEPHSFLRAPGHDWGPQARLRPRRPAPNRVAQPSPSRLNQGHVVLPGRSFRLGSRRALSRAPGREPRPTAKAKLLQPHEGREGRALHKQGRAVAAGWPASSRSSCLGEVLKKGEGDLCPALRAVLSPALQTSIRPAGRSRTSRASWRRTFRAPGRRVHPVRRASDSGRGPARGPSAASTGWSRPRELPSRTRGSFVWLGRRAT